MAWPDFVQQFQGFLSRSSAQARGVTAPPLATADPVVVSQRRPGSLEPHLHPLNPGRMDAFQRRWWGR
jgi:hypothetical protein